MPQIDLANFVAANVASPNATEGVVCTSRPIASPYPGAQLLVQFGGLWTSGAGTTSVTFRIRRDSATGTLIATAAGVVIAAAGIQLVTLAAVDSQAGDVAGQVYVLTAQQAAGTGAGGLTNGWSAITVPI